MSWRVLRRVTVLLLALGVCFLRFGWIWLIAALRGHFVTLRQRAEWMHFCGRIVLRAMGVSYRVEGKLPAGATLIVSNHLSYLDIVIASAAMPCTFVSKEEVDRWPVFGAIARRGATIFLDRQSRSSAREAASAMTGHLGAGVSVLVFPEGTSTDGGQVIRFHSPLFEPAIQAQRPVTAAAIAYEPRGESVTERDLCWFGDETFVPHLLRVLDVEGFTAVMRFANPESYADRRTAAQAAHSTVAAMRATARSAMQPGRQPGRHSGSVREVEQPLQRV